MRAITARLPSAGWHVRGPKVAGYAEGSAPERLVVGHDESAASLLEDLDQEIAMLPPRWRDRLVRVVVCRVDDVDGRLGVAWSRSGVIAAAHGSGDILSPTTRTTLVHEAAHLAPWRTSARAWKRAMAADEEHLRDLFGGAGSLQTNTRVIRAARVIDPAALRSYPRASRVDEDWARAHEIYAAERRRAALFEIDGVLIRELGVPVGIVSDEDSGVIHDAIARLGGRDGRLVMADIWPARHALCGGEWTDAPSVRPDRTLAPLADSHQISRRRSQPDAQSRSHAPRM